MAIVACTTESRCRKSPKSAATFAHVSFIKHDTQSADLGWSWELAFEAFVEMTTYIITHTKQMYTEGQFRPFHFQGLAKCVQNPANIGLKDRNP